MAETSEKEKLSMRLLIDEEKNKVVLAEAGRDFVDVLFSFLTLPMGTIVRLLEKHRRKSSPQVVVGCFNNLYKSVSDMGLESFQTETCKQMLLYPRSVNHDKYMKVKLKIDDTELVKYFVCPSIHHRESCRSFYSILNTEECGDCGEYVNSKIVRGLMNDGIQILEEEEEEEEKVKGRILRRNDEGGVFVSCEASSFVLTDDLKVASSSMDYVLNTLKGLGYENSYKLGEIILDVGLNEVLTLLECLFTSDSPLTDTFLRKQSSLRMTRSCIPLNVQESGDGTRPDKTITLRAFVRKLDNKILCVESGADFIDMLLTFLALPLESVWEFSGDDIITLGCVENLFRSFRGLNEEPEDSSSSKKCLLPSYYSCPTQLLDVVTEQEEIYYSFNRCRDGEIYDSKFTRKMPDCLKSQGENNLNLYHTRDKTADARVLYLNSFGFVRECTRFLVTDDLVIKAKDSVSNISLLKLQMHLEEKDVEEQVITIGKTEAKSLLRASMMTPSALTTCFWNLITKKA